MRLHVFASEAGLRLRGREVGAVARLLGHSARSQLRTVSIMVCGRIAAGLLVALVAAGLLVAPAAAGNNSQQQQQAAARAAAEAAKKAATEAAKKAAAEAAKKAAAEAAKKAAAEAAKKAAAEAAAKAAQQAAQKAAQAAAQQAAQKAAQQAAQKAAQQAQQAAAKASASKPPQVQQPAKTVAAPQPPKTQQPAKATPQPPKTGGTPQQPARTATVPQAPPRAAPQKPNIPQPPSAPAAPVQDEANDAAQPKPQGGTDAQQAQIEELLKQAERAAAERRVQRRQIEELRRRHARRPKPDQGPRPTFDAPAPASQQVQIDEIQRQISEADARRHEQIRHLQDLKRRQAELREAERRQREVQQQSPQVQAPAASVSVPKLLMTPEAAAAERQREAAEIVELQKEAKRFEAQRHARSQRIQELLREQAEQRQAKEQQPDTRESAPLEALQQQARRMGLGHPDEKPAAAPAAPVNLDTAQPQPLSGVETAAGAATSQVESGPANPGEPETAEAPSPGQAGLPAPQTSARGEGTSPSTSPSGKTKTPAFAASNKANAWQPEIVTEKDRNDPFGGKQDKSWHPEVVTAVMPGEGAPNSGTDVGQTPVTADPAPQSGDGTSAPAGSTKDGDKKADGGKDDPKAAAPTAKRDRRAPSRDVRPPVMGNMPVPQAEILATNMGPADFRKARELGLEAVEPTHLRNLGMRLTRLKVPRGANAAALRRRLAQQMPLGKFVDNQTYWIFGAARGGDNRGFFSRPVERKANTRITPPGYNSSATAEGSAVPSGSVPTTDPAATAAPASDGSSVASNDTTSNSSENAASESITSDSIDSESSASEEDAGTTEETAGADDGEADNGAAESESNENEVAARSDENETSRHAEMKQPDACKGDQCFASKLIKWHNDLKTCTKDVKVGIIDTSFDISHPTFRRMKGSSGEFLNGEAPSVHDWHGTAVLSLLAGDPASSTPGLIPNASFYLATAFKTDEAGNASTDTMRLLQALDWLDALDVSYINMSFSGPRDPLFEQAIDRMTAKGRVFIAAAGNQGPTAPPSYPAAYPQVIAVTAVNKNAENYRHANRGTYVDLSAPGVGIMTALPDGRQGFRTGTSFAAPFVTAIVATRSDPSHAFAGKRDLLSRLNLQDLGPPGPDPIYGQGLALAPKVCTGSEGAIAHNKRPVPKFSSAAAQ